MSSKTRNVEGQVRGACRVQQFPQPVRRYLFDWIVIYRGDRVSDEETRPEGWRRISEPDPASANPHSQLRSQGCRAIPSARTSVRRMTGIVPERAGKCYGIPVARRSLGTRFRAGARGTSLLKALETVNRPSLGQLERHGGLLAALRANRDCNRARPAYRPRKGTLGFAVFAALRLVFEALLGVEALLAGGKHEWSVALDARKNFVAVLHARAPPLGPCRFGGTMQRGGGSLRNHLRPGFHSRSILAFLRTRFRARASFTRRFSPGFR